VRALESEAVLDAQGRLAVPDEVADALSRGARVRVILLIDDPADRDENLWSRAATAEFLADDHDGDAVYDRV
jgi:DNA-binding transcriptional regulator/RsmH inhibitor MraZ